MCQLFLNKHQNLNRFGRGGPLFLKYALAVIKIYYPSKFKVVLLESSITESFFYPPFHWQIFYLFTVPPRKLSVHRRPPLQRKPPQQPNLLPRLLRRPRPPRQPQRQHHESEESDKELKFCFLCLNIIQLYSDKIKQKNLLGNFFLLC